MWKLSKEAKIRLLTHYENIINGRKFSWKNHNFTIDDFEYFIEAKFSVLNTCNLLNTIETKELNTLRELKERSDFSYEVWEDDYWDINFRKMLFYVLSDQWDLFEKRLEMNIYAENVKFDVNINERNCKNGKSLLMLSAKYFSFECTQKLIEEYGANIHLLDDNYLNCLFYAAQNPCSKTLEFLLNKKIDLNPCDENIFMWLNNNNACCVKKLFELGVDINAQNKIGETILDRLHNKLGSEKIAQELKKLGAKRNCGKKYSVPITSIHTDKEDIFDEPKHKKGVSKMYDELNQEQAIRFQHYENMLEDVKNGKLISFDGIDVIEFKIFLDWEYREFRIKEMSGELDKNSTKICEEISELYYNFDFEYDVDSDNFAEIEFIRMFNYINNSQWDLFEKQLKNGFNINTQNNSNKTLLMLSAKYCSFEKAKKLIEKYRANPHLLDYNYLNCLFYATQNSCNKTLEFLLNQGVDALPITEYSKTLLMYLKNNNAHCIKKLIKLGVNADSEDRDGRTALDIMCQSFNCDECVKILEELKAKSNYGKKGYIHCVSVQADKTDDSYKQLIDLISKQPPVKNKRAQKRLKEELEFIKEYKFANLFLLFYLTKKHPDIKTLAIGHLDPYFYLLYYLGVSEINPLELKLFSPQTVEIHRSLNFSFANELSILELEKLEFVIDISIFNTGYWNSMYNLSSHMSLERINDYFQTFYKISEEKTLCFWKDIKNLENKTLESIHKFFRKKYSKKWRSKFNYYEQYSKALLNIFDNDYFKAHNIFRFPAFSKGDFEEFCSKVEDKHYNINHFVCSYYVSLPPNPYYYDIRASYLIHLACENGLIDELIKISNQKES